MWRTITFRAALARSFRMDRYYDVQESSNFVAFRYQRRIWPARKLPLELRRYERAESPSGPNPIRVKPS